MSLLTSGSTGAPQPHAKTWGTLVGDVRAAVGSLSALLGRDSLAGLTLVATVPVPGRAPASRSSQVVTCGGEPAVVDVPASSVQQSCA